ncbi:MAG: MBOAT family protein, partial [Rikenellaceae bacterium]|nr:MBOAT family protein [Rikenellaceae bacterium]
TDFQWEVIPQFVTGYKWVFVMIILGYGLHAVPESFQQRSIDFTIKSPMVYKVVMTVAVIWVIMQLKSSEIQPFIYFQF